MKYLITAALLLFSASAYAQTADEQIATLQAQIDSLQQVAIAEGAQRTADAVNVTCDSLVIDFGIYCLPDVQDSMWVQVDFPLSTSTGMNRVFVLGAMQEAKDNVGAKDGTAAGRLRMRKDKAVTILANIGTLLAQQ